MKKEKLIRKHLGINTPRWIVENAKAMLEEYDQRRAKKSNLFSEAEHLRLLKEFNEISDEATKEVERITGTPDVGIDRAVSGFGVDRIAQERWEQVHKHGFDAAHDDKHKMGELRDFAAWIITGREELYPEGWRLKFKDKIRAKDYQDQLAVAGALLAAEIERFKRTMIINKEA